MTTKDIVQYSDVAMYKAVPTNESDTDPVEPTVTLLWMTPDPLGAIAAASEMYRGRPVRDYREITDAQRTLFWEDIKRTRLDSPYEFVDFHFLFEGVTRAFTHQLVRQRVGAVYVQESQRFAVKENGAHEVALPPSLAALKEDDPARVVWNRATDGVTIAYNALIAGGIPAEDARGLLPTNITTRIHYKTNLRSLREHAGNRLCTQAQYEWRTVWNGILAAINRVNLVRDHGQTAGDANGYDTVWRAGEVADLFKPICFTTGKCEFKANLDRFCSIRGRVNEHEERGENPRTWIDIEPREWMADPGAARLSPQDNDDRLAVGISHLD